LAYLVVEVAITLESHMQSDDFIGIKLVRIHGSTKEFDVAGERNVKHTR
jgi:hypothetical protein